MKIIICIFQLMMILIKCADISNECRPMEVAEPWIDCLLQEFFNQVRQLPFTSQVSDVRFRYQNVFIYFLYVAVVGHVHCPTFLMYATRSMRRTSGIG